MVIPLLQIALAAAAGMLVGAGGSRFAPAKWPSTTTASVLGAVAGLLAGKLAGLPPSLSWIQFFVVTPIGVVVGLGMIGAGIVMRTHSLAQGLVTAATLLMCGVIGICIGAGQAILGLAAAVVVVACLYGGGWLEQHLSKSPHDN